MTGIHHTILLVAADPPRQRWLMVRYYRQKLLDGFELLKAAVYLCKLRAGGLASGGILCPLLVLFFFATPAYAVQSHGGAEGLVSHQLGHLLFIFAMAVLLFRLNGSHLSTAGWHEFRGFLWIILFWNLLTFTGHWMHYYVEDECFIHHDTRIIAFDIHNLPDLLFYLTRLDHLLLVPAFFLLLFAIRKWGRD